MSELRQAMARAMREALAIRERGHPPHDPWETEPEWLRQKYLGCADSALAAIDAEGLMRRALTPQMFQAACKAYSASSWACLDDDALIDAIKAALAAAPKVTP